MASFGIFLSLILMLLLLFLFAPIVVCIDTIKNQYFVQLKGLAKVSFQKDETEVLKVQLKTLFMNFYFYPLRKKKASGKKNTTKKKKHKNSKISFRTGLRILQSFKLKRLLLNVDTGDCIHNAKLYPIFALINYKIGGFTINFNGKNNLELYMLNRPIYIIKSFINI